MIRVVADSALLQALLRSAPGRVRTAMRPIVDRSAQEIARLAKGFAPKAFSTLTGAITSEPKSDLESLVRAPVNYAGYVEGGTGDGGWPGVRTILDWMRVKGIVPAKPGDSPEDAAYKISRSIVLGGTPAQPFMQPAADQYAPTLVERADAALVAVIAGMNA